MRAGTAPGCMPCRYFLNLSIALDELANTFLGGSPHETISSRLGRAEASGNRWAMRICMGLSMVFGQSGHCRQSIIPGQYEAVDEEEEMIDLGSL